MNPKIETSIGLMKLIQLYEVLDFIPTIVIYPFEQIDSPLTSFDDPVEFFSRDFLGLCAEPIVVNEISQENLGLIHDELIKLKSEGFAPDLLVGLGDLKFAILDSTQIRFLYSVGSGNKKKGKIESLNRKISVIQFKSVEQLILLRTLGE